MRANDLGDAPTAIWAFIPLMAGPAAAKAFCFGFKGN